VTKRIVPACVAGLIVLSPCAIVPAAAQGALGQRSGGGAAAPTRVPVKAFKVEGNTLLPQARLDAALARHLGERSVDELKQAAAEVQALYARAGYGGVVAVLPPQPLDQGIVTIAVTEGRLAQVAIAGHRQFSEDNIRASLPGLATGATPNLKLLDQHIQIANENPAKQVQVVLEPGQRPGQTRAHVTVTEQPVRTVALALDNSGNDTTGRWRASAAWQHANVAGRDHVWSVQATVSPDKPEAVRVLSTAYRVPLYRQRLVLDAYAAYSDIDGGSTATVAGDLRFTGQGRLFGVRAGRYLPRLGEIDHRVSLGLDHRDYINSCAVAGLPPGACGPAGESVSVQPLWMEYTARKPLPVPVGVTVSLHHNLQLGGGHARAERFEAVRTGSKPRYTLLRAALSASLPVGAAWRIDGRVHAQFTGDALVPSEQFGIGGAASVRGYEERELAGDRGVAGSIELVGPNVAPAVGLANGELRPLVFVDGGRVRNRLGTPCLEVRDACSIRSAGAGARLSAGRWSAQLFVAQAHETAARTERNDTRAHVALAYSF